MTPELWPRVQALFARCADLPVPERETFLREHCGGDQALLAAVRDLLRGDARDDSLPAAIGNIANEVSEQQADRWPGTTIGAYTLESRIAQGGMGVVYLARRSDRHYDQQVAVKLLTATAAPDELYARFIAERQILANLNHPGIATLVDGGETADGIPYLVMEYIDGTPIDRYCNENRLSIAQRLELFRRVCAAVHFAHSNLVIHRDIKPSNILVTADGQPKLLDFGIAKLLDAGSRPGDADVTHYSSRVLTPRHASPEQILGERVTTASDVYSLGLLLFDLLCDDYPYRIGSTTRPRELEDTIISARPAPPSAQFAQAKDRSRIARERRCTTAQLARALHGDLDTIVLMALRKEPAARYATASELAGDLRRYAEHLPIVARRPTAAYLLSRYWLRHRAAAIGLLATILAVLAGAAAATVGFVEARHSERVARTEARNAATISDFLVSLFQEANPNNSAGHERSVRDLLDLGLARVDSELAQSPAVQAHVLETLSSVYKALADYPKATDLLQRAVSAHEAGAPDDVAGRARMLNDIGDLLRIQSHHAEAEKYIGQAIGLHRALGTTVSKDNADAVNNLSLVYQESGRPDDAERTMLEALRLRRRLYDAPDPAIALSLHNLAWHYEKSDELDKALQYAQQAVDMRVQVFGEVHPRVASSLELLSRIRLARGEPDAAETTARRAVAIAEQVFDTGHPDLSFPMYQLAAVLRAQGDVAGAGKLLAKIVAWERVSLGPDSHDLGMSIKAYARTLAELGDYKQAESLLQEALAIFERLPGGSAHALRDTRLELESLQARQAATGT